MVVNFLIVPGTESDKGERHIHLMHTRRHLRGSANHDKAESECREFHGVLRYEKEQTLSVGCSYGLPISTLSRISARWPGSPHGEIRFR